MNAPMNHYAFHVHTHRPEAEGEELELRCALLKARDYAAVLRGTVLSERAHAHACDAHEMAGGFVFAEANRTHLKAAVDYCRTLVKAAMLADIFESGA